MDELKGIAAQTKHMHVLVTTINHSDKEAAQCVCNAVALCFHLASTQLHQHIFLTNKDAQVSRTANFCAGGFLSVWTAS